MFLRCQAVFVQFSDDGRLADFEHAGDGSGRPVVLKRLSEDLLLRLLQSGCQGQFLIDCRVRVGCLFDEDKDVILRDHTMGGRDDQSLYDILQFPDIARPGVFQQDRQSVGADGFAFAEFMIAAYQVPLDERQDVIGPLPERRHVDGYDVQSVVQVLTEPVFSNQFLQVFVCR